MENTANSPSLQAMSLAQFKAQMGIQKLDVLQGAEGKRMYANLPNGEKLFFKQGIDLTKEIFVGMEKGAHNAYWAGNGKSMVVASI